MNLQIKNLKTWRGMDGIGWQGTLYLDGKREAVVTDEGCGGSIRWILTECTPGWMQRLDALKARIETYAATLPPSDGLAMDAELLVAQLADEADEARRQRRDAKHAVAP